MTFPTDRFSGAIDRLLARAGERIRLVGRSHRLDPATVDEVLQEVRIRIWKAFGESEKVADLPASYVYQTAQAAAIDLIRRHRARRGDRSDPLDPDAPAPGTSGATDLEARELGDRIEAALGDLAESRRPVVRMYLAGYGREEIGALLGWSEPKVRNLLYRGLADLREALERRGVGPGGIER